MLRRDDSTESLPPPHSVQTLAARFAAATTPNPLTLEKSRPLVPRWCHSPEKNGWEKQEIPIEEQEELEEEDDEHRETPTSDTEPGMSASPSVTHLRALWEKISAERPAHQPQPSLPTYESRQWRWLRPTLDPLCRQQQNRTRIICGIKTLTINATKVHEIELTCHACDSAFVLRAAHDCGATGEDADKKAIEDSRAVAPLETSEPPDAFPAPRAKGLEWLRDDHTEYINIAC
ncbi:hypothetical protein DFJ77DRAFT_436340 [Powellomyces hirtus]|nr:hypothetical protein DFJ77DRAFT_436340 [Powellomyces hirtus]